MERLLTEIVVPIAAAWIAWQERRILAEGISLDPEQMADARSIGVARPELVRLLRVRQVPLPGGALGRKLGPLFGSSFENTVGLTARYGIFIQEPYWGDRRLVAHELAHTRQYEQLGGVRAFLRQYLHECFTVGYVGAPMEAEADAMAERICFP